MAAFSHFAKSSELMRPDSTISLAEIGTSCTASFVLGVSMFCSSFWFLTMPSGNAMPQYSRAPFL